jgi:hypothetical protein
VACGTPAVIEDSLAAITFAPGVIGAHLDAQSLSQAITRALTLALDRNEVAAWVENNWSASVAARAYIKAMESIGHRQSSAGRSHDK